jgi:hypothetical protein
MVVAESIIDRDSFPINHSGCQLSVLLRGWEGQ